MQRALDRILAVMLAVGALAGGDAAGQEGMDEFLWGGRVVVVTATREEEHPLEAPATVVVVTDEAIRERGYLDLKDLLADLPGFDLSPNVYGEFATLVRQRGVGGNNKMVLLLDGEEIADPDGKEFPFGHNVPLSIAKRVEVVYGPASALYGPHAFGVVNIITRTADEVGGIEAAAAGGQFGTLHSSVHVGKALDEEISATLYARVYTSDGQDLSGRYPELAPIRSYPSAVRSRMEDPVRDWNVYGRIRLNDLTLGYWHSSYRQQLAKGLDPMQYVYNKEAFWGQRISGIHAKHSYSRNSFQLTGRASFTTFELNPDMNWYYLIAGEGAEEASTLKVHQYAKTNGTKFEIQATYRPSHGFGLVAGAVFEDITGLGAADIYGEPFRPGSLLYVNNYGVPQAAVSSQNYGAYGQLKWRATARMSVVGGLRVDYNTLYKETVNPRVGLVYRMGDQSVKLLYGSAFIAPSYSHLYESWFVEEYGHIQNPDIKPEKMQTLEAVWSRTWRESLETTLSVYHNRVDDLIVRRHYGGIAMSHPFVDANDDSTVFVEWSDNYGRVRSYGADLRVNAALAPALRGFINYSWIGGTNTDPNTGAEYDLFKTSSHKVAAGLTWSVRDRASLSARIRWVSGIATRSENSLYGGARMPGYHVVNFHGRVRSVVEGLDMSAWVDNLLDSRYYAAGVGSESGVYLPRVPQNGRRLLVGLTWRLPW
jgi:outer membrane cobalamin receptor